MANKLDSNDFQFPACRIRRGAVGKPSTATIKWSRESDHAEVDVVLTCDLVLDTDAVELTVQTVGGDPQGAAEFVQYAKEDGFSTLSDPHAACGYVAEWLCDLGEYMCKALSLWEAYQDRGHQLRAQVIS